MRKALRSTPNKKAQKPDASGSSPQPKAKKTHSAGPSDQSRVTQKKPVPRNSSRESGKQNTANHLVSSPHNTTYTVNSLKNKIKDVVLHGKEKKAMNYTNDVTEERENKPSSICETNKNQDHSSSQLNEQKIQTSSPSSQKMRNTRKVEKRTSTPNILKLNPDPQLPTTSGITRRDDNEKTREENILNSPSSTSTRTRTQTKVNVQDQYIQGTVDPKTLRSPANHKQVTKPKSTKRTWGSNGASPRPEIAKMSRPTSITKQTKESKHNKPIETPDSQHKRELRNLEDFWTMHGSPNATEERHLRSGTKLVKPSTPNTEPATQTASGTTARRKITFSDTEDSDVERRLSEHDYLPPKKKLRSQTKPCELWDGLSDQCQQRGPKKLKCKGNEKRVTNRDSLETGNSIKASMLPFQGNICELSMPNKYVQKDGMEESADETVIYSEFDNSINEKIERDGKPEKNKMSSKTCEEESGKCGQGVASCLPQTNFSFVNNRSYTDSQQPVYGYMILPTGSGKEREPNEINTESRCGRGHFTDNKSKDSWNDKIIYQGGFLQRNPECSLASERPVKSVNRVIVSNPFASHSDTQVYVSILNTNDERGHETSDLVNSDRQKDKLDSRSEGNVRNNRNRENSYSVSRNDNMVSLLKDMKLIYARMGEKFPKSLSQDSPDKTSGKDSDNSHITSGNCLQGLHTRTDSVVHAPTQASKSKRNPEISYGPNVSENNGTEKDISDADFVSVSEMAVANSGWSDRGVPTEVGSMSQASVVSGSASTSVLLDKINTMLDNIDSAEVRNCNNEKHTESPVACYDVEDDKNMTLSYFKERPTISDHAVFIGNAEEDSSLSIVQSSKLSVITPKRSARLKEKRAITPKQDGNSVHQSERKENKSETSKSGEDSKSRVGSDTSKFDQTPSVDPTGEDAHNEPKGNTPKQDSSVANHKNATPKTRKSEAKLDFSKLSAKLVQNKNTDKKVSKIFKSSSKEANHESGSIIQSPEIKIKIKRTPDGVIHAQTIIDGSTTTALSTNKKKFHSQPEKGLSKKTSLKIPKRKHSGTPQDEVAGSSDSACDDFDGSENDKTILEFKEAYENIQNHLNLQSQSKKRREKNEKSAKSKKKKSCEKNRKEVDTKMKPCKAQWKEENCKPKSSNKKKQKGNSNKKQKGKEKSDGLCQR